MTQPTYRVGNHWGVTIVREGTGPRDLTGPHGGQRADELVAVVVNGDQALAERICALLNGPPYPPRCTFVRGVRGCMCEPWPDCRNTEPTGSLTLDATEAIHKHLRILGYSYPSVEWDGALAAARAYVERHGAVI